MRMFVTSLAVALSIGQATAPYRIVRVDEGPKSRSFVEFRNKLLKAASEGDLSSVLREFDPNVKATRSNQKGLTALRKEFEMGPSPAFFLKEVRRVFSLGGRFTSPTTFVAPYPFIEFNETPTYTLPDYTVIVQPNAPVFERPDSASRVIVHLQDDVVRYNVGPSGWCVVWLADGRKGYVPEDAARSPVDAHAVVVKKKGQWRITEFWGGID
jgi:hypothetical protein